VIENLYGDTPPVTWIEELYGTFTIPVLLAQVITSGAIGLYPKSIVSSVELSVGNVTEAGLPLLSTAALSGCGGAMLVVGKYPCRFG
jgi:hypothetical protein